MLTCGSLFTGIEGLDMAVTEFFGAEVRWVSEVEKALLDRFTVPNLGDVTKVDWSEVEPVDIICGGYPCQPFSVAGHKRGDQDDRHLWPHFKEALRVLRPEYAVLENVSGHLRLGFDRVLADLAEVGFDARWGLVRASDVGAPHRRERLFVLASNAQSRGLHPARSTWGFDEAHDDGSGEVSAANGEGGGLQGAGNQGLPGAGLGQIEPQGDSGTPADTLGQSVRVRSGDVASPTSSPESGEAERQRLRTDDSDGGPDLAADTPDDGLNGTGQARNGRPGFEDFDWGTYRGAIERWERVMGPAPIPVDERKRLSPAFVEWMMGFPTAWTDGLTRTQSLKALGNAVVPQQAFAALLKLTMENVLAKVEAS